MTSRFGVRLCGAVIAASAVLLLAGCGKTIDPSGAAQSVTDVVSQQTGFKPTDTKCPDNVDAKVGQEFECKFMGPEGKPYTAKMKVTKVDGSRVEFDIKTAPSS